MNRGRARQRGQTWKVETAQKQLQKFAALLGKDAPPLADVPFRLEPQKDAGAGAAPAPLPFEREDED